MWATDSLRTFWMYISGSGGVCLCVCVIMHVGVTKAPCPQGKGFSSKQPAGSWLPGGKHWFLIRLIIWTAMGHFLICYSIQWGHQMQKLIFAVSGKIPCREAVKNQSNGVKNLRAQFFPRHGSMPLNRPNLQDLGLAFLLKRRKPIQVNWLSYLSQSDINASFLRQPSFSKPGPLSP